jgi:hypothetical protein
MAKLSTGARHLVKETYCFTFLRVYPMAMSSIKLKTVLPAIAMILSFNEYTAFTGMSILWIVWEQGQDVTGNVRL